MRIFRYDSTTGFKKKVSRLNIFYSPTGEFTTETSSFGLGRKSLLFLTQDEDFVDAVPDCKASIICTRVSQSMAIDRRVEIWLNAVNQFLSKKWAEKFFELYDDGTLHPVEVIKR
jgi:hypothetical protein